MAASSDTVVEIPPPETLPVERRQMGLLVMSLAMILGLAVFVSATTPQLPPIEWERGFGPDGSVNLTAWWRPVTGSRSCPV